MAWAAAIWAASCSRSSSRSFGFPGNMSPNFSMNDSNDGSMGSPASRCSIIRLRASKPFPHVGQLLGIGVGQRLGHLVEVGLGHLLAQLLHQLLEVLAGLGGHEFVVLQPPHGAGQVAREQVELHASLGGHLVGHLLAALVARGLGIGLELLDPGTLLGQHLLQLLGHLAVGPTEVTPVELLLALEPELVQQLAEALDPLAVGRLATLG